MNTLVVDNTDSKEILSSLLNEIDGIYLINSFDSFDEIEDVKNIDVIIFDINKENATTTLEKAKKLLNINSKLNFIAASYEINSELVVEVLKTPNVKEFILKPVVKPILVNAFKKIEETKNPLLIKKANTISIYSSKGATGKTSLAVNLAYEIANISKQKTCLLDLNYGDCLTFLNMTSRFDANYVISNIEKSDEKLFFSLIDRYKDSSLYVFCPNSNLNISYKKETLIRTINYFKTFFSYIIIDMPTNIDEKTAALLSNSDMILLICIYNLIAIRNTQQCLNFFENIEYPKNKVNLIINRYTQNSDLNIKDVEKTLNKEVFHNIPNNYITINDAIERGEPLAITNPNSNIYKAYNKLAQNIINTDFEDLKNNNPNANYGIYNLIRRMGE